MSEEEIQGPGFTVRDKRTFDSQGEVKESVKGEREEEKKKDKDREEKKEKEKEKEKEKGAAPLPEVNFSSFILSLSSSTLLHLGEIADPQ